MMKNGMQDFLGEIGESGCYALCLLDVAEEYLTIEQKKNLKVDYIGLLLKACEKGVITYDFSNKNNPDNFYVQYPAQFLEMVTGKKWEVTHEPAYYWIDASRYGKEFKINRWELKSCGKTTAHFERDSFHPIEDSRTVKLGKIVSTRICRVVN